MPNAFTVMLRNEGKQTLLIADEWEVGRNVGL